MKDEEKITANSEVIHLHLPDALFRVLRNEANKEDRRVQQFARVLIKEALRKRGVKLT